MICIVLKLKKLIQAYGTLKVLRMHPWWLQRCNGNCKSKKNLKRTLGLFVGNILEQMRDLDFTLGNIER